MKTKLMTESDIVKSAVELEARGAAFYSGVARKFADREIKQIFLKLAEEEKEHQKVFRQILETSSDNEIFDEKDEKYMKSLMSMSIFPPLGEQQQVANDIQTPARALAIGIQAEKDAILLYTEMYNKTGNTKAREILSKLLEEEKLHLVDLRDYLEEYEK